MLSQTKIATDGHYIEYDSPHGEIIELVLKKHAAVQWLNNTGCPI